jgi:hypothetical protein
MTAILAPAWRGSPGAGKRISVASITIPLIPAAAEDLWRLCGRTRLSATDLTNRAITSYEFFDAQLRAGRELIVRAPGTGETQLVRFG